MSISTHVPRTGHDVTADGLHVYAAKFQPTCPVRGTTIRIATGSGNMIFQPTCPVRGTTDLFFHYRHTAGISTHVPRTGHDLPVLMALWLGMRFQPTCPVRGTTRVRTLRRE